MRVLVAEDEPKTRRYLAQGLREEGMSVELTEDGSDALVLLREHSFDAVILDVMLPGADGWTIVKTLRAEGIKTPVLFLTARDQVEDRVRGFELGGDDYLVKPFAFAELLARLRNVIRRSAVTQNDTSLRIEDLTVDPLRHHVERGGRALQLTAKEYALLLVLARNRGRVLSRTLIAESVWGLCSDVQTNVVDVLVRRLRGKLDAPFDSPLVHTIRGVGYLLDSHAE
ncbi:MAG: heavy metal response regulator transcription factor [Alphaproteobacteria bacterium]|nr:heavy metal response regulator transcription factor [Alphaproteobacteria bacterium]MDE2111985.1 heavy metal response regulator transcription factor [Alphaproteobacteria bacterium]MDE2492549.1 heavy metal response regulator transcription factor [Alphaproteobacteria bacterium]